MANQSLNERDKRKAIHLLRMIGDHERATAGEVANAVSQLSKILKPYGFSFDYLIANPEMLLPGSTGSAPYNDKLLRDNQSLSSENARLRKEIADLLLKVQTLSEQLKIKTHMQNRSTLRKIWDGMDLENGPYATPLKIGLYTLLGPIGIAIKHTRHPGFYRDTSEKIMISTALCAAFWGATYYGAKKFDDHSFNAEIHAKAIHAIKDDSCDIDTDITSERNKPDRSWNPKKEPYWLYCNPKDIDPTVSPIFKRNSGPQVVVKMLNTSENGRCLQTRYQVLSTYDSQKAYSYGSDTVQYSMVCK